MYGSGIARAKTEGSRSDAKCPPKQDRLISVCR
jgi:hypothetical protein